MNADHTNLPVDETAQVLQVTSGRVRQLLRQGRIIGARHLGDPPTCVIPWPIEVVPIQGGRPRKEWLPR